LINSSGRDMPQPMVRIFPNPTAGKFTIDLSGEKSGAVKILIYNLTGQLVRTTGAVDDGIIELDMTENPSGIYLIIIQSGGRYISEILSKL